MKLAITPPLVSSPNDALAVADEVAQPADDLLLDEGRERAGVPDVDALVGDLGEQLAHDRHRQRRRREVAELARVLARSSGRRRAASRELVDAPSAAAHRVGGRGPGPSRDRSASEP